MKTKIKDYLKKTFPTHTNFQLLKFQEIGCLMLLVMFAVISLLLALFA